MPTVIEQIGDIKFVLERAGQYLKITIIQSHSEHTLPYLTLPEAEKFISAQQRAIRELAGA